LRLLPPQTPLGELTHNIPLGLLAGFKGEEKEVRERKQGEGRNGKVVRKKQGRGMKLRKPEGEEPA